MQKVIILTHNYEPTQFPPNTENKFYNYVFGENFGNLFNIN